MSFCDSGWTSQKDNVKSNGVCEMAQKFAYVRGESPASSGTIVKLICLRSVMRPVCRGSREITLSIPAHHADHDALDLDLIGLDDDRLHRRVGGLQADVPLLAIQLLQRHIGSVEQGNHHFAVVGGA